MSGPAVFIDITLEDQAVELRKHLKGLGAEISEEKSTKGIDDDLIKIISSCDACFKEGSELSDIESALNSIVSMLVQIPLEIAENLIKSFSDKLSKVSNQKHAAVALRVLWLLFQSIEPTSSVRYHVYCYIIQVAQKADQVRAVFKSLDYMKQLFVACPLTNEQLQTLLRKLHEVLVTSKQSEMAAKVMVELLGTYTEENAGQAKEDAQRCIVSAIADPNTFLLDPLLSLKPIRCLEGEKIYDLLNIFVSEKVSAYLKFYKAHKDFINKSGLDHGQNLKKMRLLTFMQLAEASNEVPYETIWKELHMGEQDVEPFIIEALKTKLVKTRIDQTAKKVYVSSTMHRTFALPQWQELRDVLHSWKVNLATIDEAMNNIVTNAQANQPTTSSTSVVI